MFLQTIPFLDLFLLYSLWLIQSPSTPEPLPAQRALHSLMATGFFQSQKGLLSSVIRLTLNPSQHLHGLYFSSFLYSEFLLHGRLRLSADKHAQHVPTLEDLLCHLLLFLIKLFLICLPTANLPHQPPAPLKLLLLTKITNYPLITISSRYFSVLLLLNLFGLYS